MRSDKAKRRLRFVAVFSAGALFVFGALYAFRWPIFGGWISSKVEQQVRAALQSEVRVGRWSGTLVSSLRARSVELLPHPDSPLRTARAAPVDVSYGFLAISGMHVRVRGPRVALAASAKEPRPAHETIREVFSSLETARLPAEVQVEQATILQPGGATLEIERASLHGDELTAVIRSEVTGRVDLDLKRGKHHQLRLRART